MKPTVAIVGGFLGAGKTTLILKAAKLLQSKGIKVAAILNDQGDDLVDAELMRHSAIATDQVSGGCFCCRFPDLLEALDRLSTYQPEIIFAEAVGSCVDLAATTLRPLMRDYPSNYRIAPLTVLVHEEPSAPELRFLFERQVAEADLVIGRAVDVSTWLDTLLADGIQAGAKSLEVDYQRYAEAEASLGWLNARVTVRPISPVSPAMILGPLIDELDRSLTAAGIIIVHLKSIAQCGSGYVKAALTGNGREPVVEGVLDASPAALHEVLINLRALGPPDELRELVERAFAEMPASWNAIQAFSPSPPVPYLRLEIPS